MPRLNQTPISFPSLSKPNEVFPISHRAISLFQRRLSELHDSCSLLSHRDTKSRVTEIIQAHVARICRRLTSKLSTTAVTIRVPRTLQEGASLNLRGRSSVFGDHATTWTFVLESCVLRLGRPSMLSEHYLNSEDEAHLTEAFTVPILFPIVSSMFQTRAACQTLLVENQMSKAS